MSRRLRFLEGTRAEIEEAFDWYDLRNQSAGMALLNEIDDDEVVIVAVAHQSRRPGYWRIRLQ